MKHIVLHTAKWQAERKNALSIGYCFMNVDTIQGNPSKTPGLCDKFVS